METADLWYLRNSIFHLKGSFLTYDLDTSKFIKPLGGKKKYTIDNMEYTLKTCNLIIFIKRVENNNITSTAWFYTTLLQTDNVMNSK